MDDAPLPEGDAKTLRFLRLLVTVLTATMIAGLLVLIVLFVTRFPAPAALPALPDRLEMPNGVTARAATFGENWIAVVTDADEILVFDATTGALRQRVTLDD